MHLLNEQEKWKEGERQGQMVCNQLQNSTETLKPSAYQGEFQLHYSMNQL